MRYLLLGESLAKASTASGGIPSVKSRADPGNLCYMIDIYRTYPLEMEVLYGFMGKSWEYMGIPSGYVKIAIENGSFIVDLPIKNCDFP